jgi:hypothetical protein
MESVTCSKAGYTSITCSKILNKKIKLNLKVEKQYEIYKKKHLYLFLLQLNDKNFRKIEKEMN